MTCQTTGCDAAATEVLIVFDVPRNLCRLHAAHVEVWELLTAPDDDPRPHRERECCLCHDDDRAPGRAICWRCMSRAYAVHAAGGAR